MSTLHIPVLEPSCSTLTAALAYAEAGWFVGPCRSGTKNPGSVLGEGWDEQTSRDTAQITAWFAGTDHDVFLHAGRSGAVIFDVDHPERIIADIEKAIADLVPPYQSTRADQPGRGHYLFGQPDGRVLGNSLGTLGNGWGEIRGRNGVIIVEPSVHVEADGRYKWETTGLVPVLPDYLADQLGDALDAADPATGAEVAVFLAEHSSNTRPELLNVHAEAFDNAVRAGESRHDTMPGHLTGAMKEAAAGLLDATLAADTLESLFLAAVAKAPLSPKQNPARTGAPARKEWRGLLAWAVGQARAADPDETRTRSAEKVPPLTVLTDAVADAEEAFWTARPSLTLIHDYARATSTGPWALLGAVLARLTAAVPPFIVLPATIGTWASLNLFIALVGLSGSGKGNAGGVADDILDLPPVTVASIGSGEGLAHLFARRVLAGARKGDQERIATAVLLDIAEIDTLTGLANRSGSTMWPELRKGFMGEALGFAYVDPAKKLRVDKHTYRLCMTIGVQPGQAGPLMADVIGGTPQRMLFLPTTDPSAPVAPPPRPTERLTIDPRNLGNRQALGQLRSMTLPDIAVGEIVAAQHARLTGSSDALDGHRLLVRAKIAAALAILDTDRPGNRMVITAEDWALSDILMRVSDATRQQIHATLDGIAKKSNTARALAEGERQVIATGVVATDNSVRVGKRVITVLTRHGTWTSRRDLRSEIARRDSEVLDEVLPMMIASGQVEIDNSDPKRPSYRLANHDH